MADNLSVKDGSGATQTLATSDIGSVHFPKHQGAGAHDAAIVGNPQRIAGRALTTAYTAVTAGDTADVAVTLDGRMVTAGQALPADTWLYSGLTGGITNTSNVQIAAAGAAGIRNYVTGLQYANSSTVDSEIVIKDGGTAIWRGIAPAKVAGQNTQQINIRFDPPLRGTAASAMNVALITTGTATVVSAQGFVAA